MLLKVNYYCSWLLSLCDCIKFVSMCKLLPLTRAFVLLKCYFPALESQLEGRSVNKKISLKSWEKFEKCELNLDLNQKFIFFKHSFTRHSLDLLSSSSHLSISLQLHCFFFFAQNIFRLFALPELVFFHPAVVLQKDYKKGCPSLVTTIPLKVD